MKLKDALELMKEPEKLRIRAAELDGWVLTERLVNPEYNAATHCDQFDAGYKYGNLLQIPNYPYDPASLHEAEKRLGLHDRSNTALRVKWVNCLHDLVGAQPECPVNKSGSPLVSDIDVLLCSTLIRCAAYVMTAEWKEAQK